MDLEGLRRVNQVLSDASKTLHSNTPPVVTPEEYRFADYEKVRERSAPGYKRVRYVAVHTGLPIDSILNALSHANMMASNNVPIAESPQFKFLGSVGAGHLLLEDVTEQQSDY